MNLLNSDRETCSHRERERGVYLCICIHTIVTEATQLGFNHMTAFLLKFRVQSQPERSAQTERTVCMLLF